MSDNSEYRILSLNKDFQKRKEYWEIAKGLQDVDLLSTSEYLEEIIEDTLVGRYDTAKANEKVSRYYQEVTSADPEFVNKEADLATARITLILERDSFKFSPASLKVIHREIFRGGILADENWVGNFRTKNIAKSEAILGGLSVQYADYSAIGETLKYDFAEERESRYQLPFTPEQIKNLATFVSNIWQTHPFMEGNTRTTATFLILYLRNMGIEINNDPFQTHALYFRNALVRSNFASIKDGIQRDMTYLLRFFENVLLGAAHDLASDDLNCQALLPPGNKKI